MPNHAAKHPPQDESGSGRHAGGSGRHFGTTPNSAIRTSRLRFASCRHCASRWHHANRRLPWGMARPVDRALAGTAAAPLAAPGGQRAARMALRAQRAPEQRRPLAKGAATPRAQAAHAEAAGGRPSNLPPALTASPAAAKAAQQARRQLRAKVPLHHALLAASVPARSAAAKVPLHRAPAGEEWAE